MFNIIDIRYICHILLIRILKYLCLCNDNEFSLCILRISDSNRVCTEDCKVMAKLFVSDAPLPNFQSESCSLVFHNLIFCVSNIWFLPLFLRHPYFQNSNVAVIAALLFYNLVHALARKRKLHLFDPTISFAIPLKVGRSYVPLHFHYFFSNGCDAKQVQLCYIFD